MGELTTTKSNEFSNVSSFKRSMNIIEEMIYLFIFIDNYLKINLHQWIFSIYNYIINMRLQGGRQQGDLFEGYDVDREGFQISD